MDLRIIKTKKAIKEAFCQLIAKKTIEQIRVTEICAIALINKTTFYKHYQDVYQLENIIRKEVLDELFESFNEKSLLISNTAEFASGLPKFFETNKQKINLFFRANMPMFFYEFEKKLCDYYLSEVAPNFDVALLLFMFAGIICTLPILKFDLKMPQEQIVEKISNIVKKLTN